MDLVTIVITACTSRKRKPVGESLRMSAVPQLPIAALAADWGRRLEAATDVYPAGEIYGGRSFREATLAAQSLDARLMIVSAGLGLIDADSIVPSYGCTVLPDTGDSIATRAVGAYSVTDWWQALKSKSPFAQSLSSVTGQSGGLICAALSEAYIELIVGEIRSLPTDTLMRLRLFTRTPPERVGPMLRPFVMPYDDRLDGPDSPVRGTRGDFASRALRHFAAFVAKGNDGQSAADDAAVVATSLAGWRMPATFDRRRLNDKEVLRLIDVHWDAERGSTARLLRRFRDDLGVACEQGRFAALARQVRAERA